MKNNTFDIPTYKFYVVKYEMPFQLLGISNYEESIKTQQCTLIPYEEVDGLTFGDLKDIGLKGELFIGCFCEFKSLDKKCYRVPIFYSKDTNSRDLKDRPIDEVVTETLENIYSLASDYEKKNISMFF